VKSGLVMLSTMRLMLSSRASIFVAAALGAFGATGACSSNPQLISDRDADGDSDSDADAGGASGNDSDGVTDGVDGGGGGDGADSGSGGGGPVCETTSNEAELAPIFLAFAFDVSGSMGQLDRPNWWHDPTKKWEPVVAATRAFFEDDNSAGISASLTLFPTTGNSATKCAVDSYQSPLVSMQGLPSDSFGDAFVQYETEVGDPLAGGNWRGSTPTLAACNGTWGYLDSLRPDSPDSKFALVLVTDGLPQGCSGQTDGDTGPIVTAVAAVLADGVPTYVIGIQNPTTPPDTIPANWAPQDRGCASNTWCTPPDTLSALNGVAAAGGTEAAFLIDTGNPTATQAAFRQAIDAIRARAISCELGIPPHPVPGQSFDKDRINVSETVDGDKSDFAYDPDCENGDSWHYDDADQPTKIELCPTTCAAVQATPGATLNVDFLCVPRPDVIR